MRGRAVHVALPAAARPVAGAEPVAAQERPAALYPLGHVRVLAVPHPRVIARVQIVERNERVVLGAAMAGIERQTAIDGVVPRRGNVRQVLDIANFGKLFKIS